MTIIIKYDFINFYLFLVEWEDELPVFAPLEGDEVLVEDELGDDDRVELGLEEEDLEGRLEFVLELLE